VKLQIEFHQPIVVLTRRTPAGRKNHKNLEVGMVNGGSLALKERLSRRLNHTDVQDVCKIFLVFFVLAMVVSFVTAARNQGHTVFGEALGADFPAFYAAGQIINEHGAVRLYDRALQRQIYHQLFPLEDPSSALVYANAPFFFLCFPLLARLPYVWAYAAWVLIALAFYLGSIVLLWRELKGVPPAAYRTAILVAVTFFPFMVEVLGGGQTTPFGFFSLALALTLERRGRNLASGAVLALVIYKPTLMLLIGPMLLLTRRWRVLAGMVLGGSVLALISFALVGRTGLVAWIETLLFYSQSSASATTVLRTWKYVDVNSFARGLWGEHIVWRWLTSGLVVLIFVPQLLRAWWLADSSEEAQRQTGWVIALAWLPVLNVYLGFYDATLMALSVVLVTEWFYQQADELPSSYRFMLMALYLTPWLSQPLARNAGIQIFTITLMVWGGYVLRLVARVRVADWQAAFEAPKIVPVVTEAAVASTNC
jgi:Glycosyltransferase family 87